MTFRDFLSHYTHRINQQLDAYLTHTDSPSKLLYEAMRYSVLTEGKCIRPLLVYTIGKLFNTNDEALDAPACAVELIHCYSLIHDDLPAMDDDSLRRGKLTCHKAFDEATAILAGDALQALAFQIIAHDQNEALRTGQRLALIQTLSHACGPEGMAGGQALDLAATQKSIDVNYVETMHHLKTAALIVASATMGAIVGHASRDELHHIHQFAKKLGLAFQIQDDILDIEASTAQLGKTQGTDHAQQKITYPIVTSIDTAKARVHELHESLLENINQLPMPTDSIIEFCQFILHRKK